MRHVRMSWRSWLSRGLTFAALAILLAACAGENYPQSTLHPKGDFAEKVDALFQTTVFWAAIIFVLVEGALLWAIFRFKGHPDDPEPKQVHGNTMIEIIWTAIPAMVLAFVAVPTVRTIFETAQIPEATAETGEPIKVEVIGHQWWWEFRYPDLGIVTANELHVPVNRTIDLRMKTVDVLHSFWIPQFAGKRDVFPNRETRIWFTARETGAYPGACAEFCGLQHGKMLFYVMASEQSEFDGWVARRQADSAAAAIRPPAPATDSMAPAPAPEDALVAQGRQLFMTKACVGCHSPGSAGAATASIGPNLGGIATRRMIAAGWLENTDENLAHWIQNPEQFKEGTLMKVGPITDAEAQALVAFLRTRQ
ncbi:MAG TPA: cytochrome c oxidase subunit II [Gemmatimonadales bacterium]|nr:cytochrome c oxidase subunit II [Gemmatimonadales bacterium]